MTTHYHAYLLRLWQTGGADNLTWRASLEDPHTRQVIGFGSLDALLEYLRHFVGSGTSVGSGTTVGSGVALPNPSVAEFNSDPIGVRESNSRTNGILKAKERIP